MPRFLFSVIIATIFSIIILAIFAVKTEPESIIVNFIFSFFVFVTLSLVIALAFFFLRTGVKSFVYRKTRRLEEILSVGEQRLLFRRSFKMAVPIAGFLGIIVFLRTNQILTVFNLVILLAIIVLGAIYIRTR
jgi:hypothetical protein